MSLEQVQAILGKGKCFLRIGGSKMPRSELWEWESGQAYVRAEFTENELQKKSVSFRTLSETMKWYTKKGAEKIGVKWD
jgi:hypothetical protein